MPELFVKDIFHEYVDEIESDFKKIKEVSCGQGWLESSYFVGTLSRVARKIYMKYGQRIITYEQSKYAEDIIYRQLLGCTHDLQRKYFGYIVG